MADDKTAAVGLNTLSEDILPVIFDNLDILTPKDLLNFRFVNRCWRDAATSVLLKRNACNIVLELKVGQVVLGGKKKNASPKLIYCNARQSHNSRLQDLIRLISTSPKFPSNSITFLPGCEKSLNNLSSSPANEDHNLEKNKLMRLFSLYGKKIKKLSISTGVSASTVQNLLFVHLPNLICLDLGNCLQFDTIDPQPSQIFNFPTSNNSNSNSCQFLKLQRIYSGKEPMFHYSKAKVLEELINLSPNLQVIQDVGAGGLSVLLKMRKAHLLKCLYYNPPNDWEYMDLLAELRSQPDMLPLLKLKEITAKFSSCSDSVTALAMYGKETGILNMLLEGSKDTLEYLELHINPNNFLTDIKIPPLKNLKCLRLVNDEEYFGYLFQSNKGDENVFQFENEEEPNRIPPGYFPALSKVHLDVDLVSLNHNSQLLTFFSLEHTDLDTGSIVSGDTVSSVTTLEIAIFLGWDGKALGKLFPNVRYLKIKCQPEPRLQNWVWKAFPKVEKLGIYDFDPQRPIWDKKCNCDYFFTGILEELCTKFSDNIEGSAAQEFSTTQINFLRTRPYIGDCTNLKEFTLQFKAKITSGFVSNLTGLYAFRGLSDQTKITFSFETVQLNEQEWQDIQTHLEPVASFIEISRFGKLIL